MYAIHTVDHLGIRDWYDRLTSLRETKVCRSVCVCGDDGGRDLTAARMSLPAHTYPAASLYLSQFPPPDDLRIASLGRPITSYGPKSFVPSPADRIAMLEQQRPSTTRLETLPGPINRRSYLVQPTSFDIRVGRAKTLLVPFTMTSGLSPPKFASPTPRVSAAARSFSLSPPPSLPLSPVTPPRYGRSSHGFY